MLKNDVWLWPSMISCLSNSARLEELENKIQNVLYIKNIFRNQSSLPNWTQNGQYTIIRKGSLIFKSKIETYHSMLHSHMLNHMDYAQVEIRVTFWFKHYRYCIQILVRTSSYFLFVWPIIAMCRSQQVSLAIIQVFFTASSALTG